MKTKCSLHFPYTSGMFCCRKVLRMKVKLTPKLTFKLKLGLMLMLKLPFKTALDLKRKLRVWL